MKRKAKEIQKMTEGAAKARLSTCVLSEADLTRADLFQASLTRCASPLSIFPMP